MTKEESEDRLRVVENDVAVLKTKLQAIWWIVNIIGGTVIVWVVNRTLGK